MAAMAVMAVMAVTKPSYFLEMFTLRTIMLTATVEQSTCLARVATVGLELVETATEDLAGLAATKQ